MILLISFGDAAMSNLAIIESSPIRNGFGNVHLAIGDSLPELIQVT
jgi:hypothetical protein